MSAITSEIASNPPMMQTTLRKIRAADPCGMRLEDGQRVGYLKLRHHLGKGYGDDTHLEYRLLIEIAHSRITRARAKLEADQ